MKNKILAQTWSERLADADRIPLCPDFIASLVLTAGANSKTVDDLWTMWRSYVQTCKGYDQSPKFREFCSWNKLQGRGPIA